MKKLIIFMCIFAFSAPVYAGFLGIGEKEATKQENTNIFNMAEKAACGKTGDQSRANFKESQWNVDVDFMPYVFPDQPAQPQFRTDSFTLGATYKFSDFVHMWTKYVQLTIDGDKLDGNPTSWKHTHVLGGFGVRVNVNDNQQVQFNAGAGSSEIEEKESGESVENLGTPIAVEFKYLWAYDNLSYGVIYSIVDVPSTSEESGSYIKGGYNYVGLTVQVGIQGL